MKYFQKQENWQPCHQPLKIWIKQSKRLIASKEQEGNGAYKLVCAYKHAPGKNRMEP